MWKSVTSSCSKWFTNFPPQLTGPRDISQIMSMFAVPSRDLSLLTSVPPRTSSSSVHQTYLNQSGARSNDLLTNAKVCYVPVRYRFPKTIGFIHCDMQTGRKKPDEEVLKRFFRLDWGGWIRRIAGSSKRVWKMKRRVRRKREYHVLVSRTYSKMFDKMVTQEYREPKYYVDDMYNPYQRRYTDHTFPVYHSSEQEVTLKKLDYPELSPEILSQRRAAALAAVSPETLNSGKAPQ